MDWVEKALSPYASQLRIVFILLSWRNIRCNAFLCIIRGQADKVSLRTVSAARYYYHYDTCDPHITIRGSLDLVVAL